MERQTCETTKTKCPSEKNKSLHEREEDERSVGTLHGILAVLSFNDHFVLRAHTGDAALKLNFCNIEKLKLRIFLTPDGSSNGCHGNGRHPACVCLTGGEVVSPVADGDGLVPAGRRWEPGPSPQAHWVAAQSHGISKPAWSPGKKNEKKRETQKAESESCSFEGHSASLLRSFALQRRCSA